MTKNLHDSQSHSGKPPTQLRGDEVSKNHQKWGEMQDFLYKWVLANREDSLKRGESLIFLMS